MTAPSPSLREAAQMALEAMERYESKRQDDRFVVEVEVLRAALALPDKPVLYRYQGSESVIPVMPGYSPGPG